MATGACAYRFATPGILACTLNRTGTAPMPDALMVTLIILAVVLPVAYAGFCRRI
jgi:hypothetical protein